MHTGLFGKYAGKVYLEVKDVLYTAVVSDLLLGTMSGSVARGVASGLSGAGFLPPDEAMVSPASSL